MTAKLKFLLTLLVLSLALLLFLQSCWRLYVKEDPEVELCKKQCQRQQQFDRDQKWVCRRLCEEYGREKEERQREHGGAGREELERQRVRCKHQCRVGQLSERDEERCTDRCEEQYWEERQKQERGRSHLRKLGFDVLFKTANEAMYGRA